MDPNSASVGEGIFGLTCEPADAAVVLVPVPFDATTSYRAGAAGGPAAIHQASMQIDLRDREVGDPWRTGIALAAPLERIVDCNREARPLVDSMRDTPGSVTGDEALARVNALCEEVNDLVTEEVGRWLDAGKLVGLVGGDHATAFGAIRAQAERDSDFGILHVDAHADLRRDYEGFRWSHASVMEAVYRLLEDVGPIVQVGIRDFCEEEAQRIESSGGRLRAHFDADLSRRLLEGETWQAMVAEMLEPLPKRVYISFDIDGLDPTLCPNTGTPVPGGLSYAQALYLLHALVSSGREVIGFDLVEVAPGPDGDEWDGNVGARLVYKLIGWALASAPGRQSQES